MEPCPQTPAQCVAARAPVLGLHLGPSDIWPWSLVSSLFSHCSLPSLWGARAGPLVMCSAAGLCRSSQGSIRDLLGVSGLQGEADGWGWGLCWRTTWQSDCNGEILPRRNNSLKLSKWKTLIYTSRKLDELQSFQHKRFTNRHVILNMLKVKDKEEISKAAGEKCWVTHKGSPVRLTADFPSETVETRSSGTMYSKCSK